MMQPDASWAQVEAAWSQTTAAWHQSHAAWWTFASAVVGLIFIWLQVRAIGGQIEASTSAATGDIRWRKLDATFQIIKESELMGLKVRALRQKVYEGVPSGTQLGLAKEQELLIGLFSKDDSVKHICFDIMNFYERVGGARKNKYILDKVAFDHISTDVQVLFKLFKPIIYDRRKKTNDHALCELFEELVHDWDQFREDLTKKSKEAGRVPLDD